MQTSIGWKPILLLCCAALSIQTAFAQPVSNTAQDATAPESRPVSRTLADLGHPSGFQRSGTHSSINFSIPTPLDTPTSNARLVLHHAVASAVGAEAVMQVLVNGELRLVTSLADGPGSAGRVGAGGSGQRVLSIPLTAEDLAQPRLDVTVRTRFESATLCPRPEPGSNLFQVLPQTALSYRVQPDATPSLRGYLSTLPTNTRVALAPGVPAEALRAAWLMSHELQGRGHRVSFTTPQNGADILIAPRAALDALSVDLEASSSMGLAKPDPDQPYRSQLVITEPYRNDALSAPWSLLLSGSQHSSSNAAPSERQPPETPTLAQLGVDTEARPFTGSAEWRFSARNLPPGRVPATLKLDLIVPPSQNHDPVVLYVLQNEAVRGLATLPSEGGEQRVAVPLKRMEGFAEGPVRIVLMRQSHSDCNTAAVPGFVQLLPSSTLETTAMNRSAETLADFARTLAATYSVHLPADAADRPLAWASALASLSRHLGIDPRHMTLQTTREAPFENRPFIWFGLEPPEGFDSPVSVSRGRMQVRDPSGGVLLDTAEIPGASMIALLRGGERRGLWLRALGEGVPALPAALHDSPADLVFGDQSGIMVALATRSDTVASIAYPERRSLAGDLGPYRIWIFALIWIVLTIVVIAVARRMRKH